MVNFHGHVKLPECIPSLLLLYVHYYPQYYPNKVSWFSQWFSQCLISNPSATAKVHPPSAAGSAGWSHWRRGARCVHRADNDQSVRGGLKPSIDGRIKGHDGMFLHWFIDLLIDLSICLVVYSFCLLVIYRYNIYIYIYIYGLYEWLILMGPECLKPNIYWGYDSA